MADTQGIEILLEDLKIPLPEKLAQTRAVFDKLSVLDVPLAPMPTTQGIADIIRGAVQRGEEVDPVALVRQAREGADNEEAARAVAVALKDASHLHELAFRGGGGLIPVVTAAIEKLYAKVRTLPNNTPTDAFEAVHADEKALAAFRVLEGFANRHAMLRRLHRVLIADEAQEDAVILFADTRRNPDAVPSRVQPAEPTGPREAFARLKWLARPDAEAWVPTAAEVNERYQEFVVAISNRLIGITSNKEN